MLTKPIYKSVPTVRNYEDYILECEYIKGWNDAMNFIFLEEKEKREKVKLKESLKLMVNNKTE